VEVLPGYPLPEQEKSYQHAFINALNMAIKGIKKSQKGDFVSSIGSSLAVVRQVQYPVAVKDKLLSAIQWEVRKFIPYEPEEVVVDAQILVSGDTKMDVLLAAVPKEHLKHHQTVLSGGGLTSQTVDADSIALMNAMMTQINLQPQETVLMIDVGAKTTLLNMFQMGGLFFSRSLSIAGNRFTQVIGSELKKEFSEAEAIKRGESGGGNGYNPERVADILTPSYKQLYSEIQKSIMFYNKQTGVKDFHYLFLSGGGANLPGLKEFLSGKLGKNIALLSPVAGLEVDEKNITKESLAQFGPQIALAVGLAFRTR
jgi:type IV pilus assembly protein PilM